MPVFGVKNIEQLLRGLKLELLESFIKFGSTVSMCTDTNKQTKQRDSS